MSLCTKTEVAFAGPELLFSFAQFKNNKTTLSVSCNLSPGTLHVSSDALQRDTHSWTEGDLRELAGLQNIDFELVDFIAKIKLFLKI